MDSTASQIEHLYDLLREFSTTMFITRTDDGGLLVRPMAVAELGRNGYVYLVTSVGSKKVWETGANESVTLVFQNPRQFASLSGRATVVRDQELVDRLWSEAWKVWFPNGRTDPDICMIEIKPATGEYWDNAGTQGLKFAFEAAKAYVTGTTPTVAEGPQHGRVDL